MTHIELKNLQYPIFEANQVLSSNHLNELLRYLDDSDRATRSHTIGTGWLGGAELLMRMRQGKLDQIRLTCGAGITSLGYLAVIDDCVLRFAEAYEDPYRDVPEDGDEAVAIGYDPFWKMDASERVQREIWELKTAAEVETLSGADRTKARTQFEALNPRDYIVLVYVEADQQDIKSCFSEDCTDRGQRMLVNVRKLAMKRSEFPAAAFAPTRAPSALAPFAMERPTDYGNGDLPQVYKPIFDRFINSFDGAMARLVRQFGTYLPPGSPSMQGSYFKDRLVPKLEQLPDDQIQVFYDHLRDLAAAYNEMVALGATLNSQACANAQAFPRHLFLAEMQPEDPRAPFLEARHYFRAPPEASKEETAIRQLRRLFLKTIYLARQFKPTGLPENTVKMLPQASLSPSDNVIPYYYDLAGNNGRALRQLWTREPAAAQALPLITHHYRDQGQNPFALTLDGQRMARVEGLLGSDAVLALRGIKARQKQFGLSFDVVEIYLDDNFLPDREGAGFGRGGAAYYDFSDDEGRYDRFRSALKLQLKAVQLALAKTLEQSGDWLDFVVKQPPEAKRLVDAIESLSASLPSRLSIMNRVAFLTSYFRVLRAAAEYRLDLSRYFQDMVGQPFRSVGIAQAGIRGATPYLTLMSLAFAELMGYIDGLFSAFNSNPIVQLKDKYEADMRARKAADPRLFANFYERHQGIEHIAGSTFDGSLVVLIKNQKIVGDFYLPYLCCCECPPPSVHLNSAELYPSYHQAVWDEEIVLGRLSAFGGAGASHFVTSLKNTGRNQFYNDKAFSKKAERLSTEELPTIVDGEGSTIYRKDIDGETYLMLAPQPKAIDSLIEFVVGVKGEQVVRHPCWVNILSPVLIAHDDTAVTIREKPVTIRVIDNDLTAFPNVKIGLVRAPERGDVEQDEKRSGEFIYIPHPKKKGQGTDTFEYQLVCGLPNGKRLVSRATVTVHIVECCEHAAPPDDDDHEPVRIEGTLTLPDLDFCADDIDGVYHFRGEGEVFNIRSAGLGYLDARGQLKKNMIGKQLTDNDLREQKLKRVFVPGAAKLPAGKHIITYDAISATGARVSKRLEVMIFRFSEAFQYRQVGSNKRKIKFSYAYEPAGAEVEYSWMVTEAAQVDTTRPHIDVGDFGIGGTGTFWRALMPTKTYKSAAPTHEFQTYGSHTVTLSVRPKRSNTCSHIIPKTIHIKDPNMLDIDWARVREVPRIPPRRPPEWEPVIPDDDVDWEIYLNDHNEKLESWARYKKLLGDSLSNDRTYESYRENRLDKDLEKEASKIFTSVNKIAEADIATATGPRYEALGGMIENPAATVAEFYAGKPTMTNEAKASFKAAYESMELGKKAGVTYSGDFITGLNKVIENAESPEVAEAVKRMRTIAMT